MTIAFNLELSSKDCSFFALYAGLRMYADLQLAKSIETGAPVQAHFEVSSYLLQLQKQHPEPYQAAERAYEETYTGKINHSGILISQMRDEVPFKTGEQEISEEAYEVLFKHGFSVKHDAEFYQNGELLSAASYALGLSECWPENWVADNKEKIDKKDQIGKLRVAGAFIASEINRIKYLQAEELNDL